MPDEAAVPIQRVIRRFRREALYCIGSDHQVCKRGRPRRCRPPVSESPSNLSTSRVGDVESLTKTFILRPDTTILMWFQPFSRSGARV